MEHSRYSGVLLRYLLWVSELPHLPLSNPLPLMDIKWFLFAALGKYIRHRESIFQPINRAKEH